MEPEDFCRWLQGMLDLSKAEELDERQIKIVREHLNLVFQDVTGYGRAGLAEGDVIDEQGSEGGFDPFNLPTLCTQVDQKTDPHYVKNVWAIDPRIKTVVSC